MPDCRYCGHEGAYDSGFSVECPNFDCDHYSRSQRSEYLKHNRKWRETQKLLSEYLTEDSSDPDKTPTYHWGIDSPLLSDPED